MTTSDVIRWTAKVKEEIVLAVHADPLGREHILRSRGVPEEEFRLWDDRFAGGGREALRSSAIQAAGGVSAEAKVVALLLAISRSRKPIRELGAALDYDWPTTTRLVYLLRRRGNVAYVHRGRTGSLSVYKLTHRGLGILRGGSK